MDERTCRMAGNGKAIPSSLISLTCGAEPPKKEPLTSSGSPVVSLIVIRIHSSPGNGSCNTGTIDPINELDKTRSISHTWSGRRRETMMFSNKDLDFGSLYRTTNGKVGQDCRISMKCAPYSQRIRRSRRRGAMEMTWRHCLQTCVRMCHFHSLPLDRLMAPCR